ncbi:hypothetical protein ACCE15_19280 [Pseudomonas parafulva]|uniref:hypothetical protein n=1 Tax=Pseudomonas parafulva TaxID=157782 RepID=UPI0035696A0F
MDNKFKRGIEERKAQQVEPVVKKHADLESFLQSAASDGALVNPTPEVAVAVEQPELSLLDRLKADLSEHQELVRQTRKKGKIERITTSIYKEQLMKAEIIKMMIEDEKGMNLSMSQVFAMLVDKRFDELINLQK